MGISGIGIGKYLRVCICMCVQCGEVHLHERSSSLVIQFYLCLLHLYIQTYTHIYTYFHKYINMHTQINLNAHDAQYIMINTHQFHSDYQVSASRKKHKNKQTHTHKKERNEEETKKERASINVEILTLSIRVCSSLHISIFFFNSNNSELFGGNRRI